MIEETLLEDLLMETRTVKTCRETQLNITFERFIAWGSHNPIGIVALIEDEALKNDLAVDLNGFPLNSHRTQTGITTHAINCLSFRIKQRNLQIIQMGIIWRPEAAALGGDRQIELWRKIEISSTGSACHNACGVAQSCRKLHTRLNIGNRLLQAKLTICHIGRDARTFQRRERHRLQPHRLPDTR